MKSLNARNCSHSCLFILLLAFSGASMSASMEGAEPSVQEMVDALAKKRSEGAPGIRTRSIGAKSAGTAEAGGQLRLAVQFEFASAQISPESGGLLAKLATAMQHDALSTLQFRIEGHTDSVGSADANQRLSERRAASVRQFLVSQGIAAARLQAVGKGSTEPQDASDPKAAVNRRVVVTAIASDSVAAVASRPTHAPAPVEKLVVRPSAGMVRQMQGNATVNRHNVALKLDVSDTVLEGDTIHTEAGASVLVLLGDGGRLLVRPSTSVTLTKMVHSGPLAKLAHAISLVGGAIRYVTGSVGKAQPQAVRFKTPTMTMGIRGTDVEIVYSPQTRGLAESGTYVKVNAGAVELSGADGAVLGLVKDEQAFAGALGTRTRGSAVATTRKQIAPEAIFATSELDRMMNSR